MPLASRHLTFSPLSLSLRVTWAAVADSVTAVPFAFEVRPVEVNDANVLSCGVSDSTKC